MIEAAARLGGEAGGTLIAGGIVARVPERVLEGEWHGNRTVIVEFPTVDAAQRWYDSAECQAVIGIRHEAAETNGVIIIARFDPAADMARRGRGELYGLRFDKAFAAERLEVGQVVVVDGRVLERILRTLARCGLYSSRFLVRPRATVRISVNWCLAARGT